MYVSVPLLLLSDGTALLSILILVSLEPELSLLTSPEKESSLGGAAHDPRLHVMPVILLSVNPFRSHLLQGLPDLSRARRPALMAPVLALGPSLWAVMGATPPKGPFFTDGSAERSMVPSALSLLSVHAVYTTAR